MAETAETAIAVQEAPALNKLVFFAAGLGALLSALAALLGAGDPSVGSLRVFFATPLIPVLCAGLLWLLFSFTKGSEARRQSVAAAGLSPSFALMPFAWGSRLQHRELKWAALPFFSSPRRLSVP